MCCDHSSILKAVTFPGHGSPANIDHMTPWDNWYHCNGNTYGTWLPGDPRGWRSEDHKIHVDGDYKSPPPPGSDEGLHEHSQNRMKNDAVFLSQFHCFQALDIWVSALQHYQLEIAAIAIGSHHWHVLAKFPDHQPRITIGKVKSWSTRQLDIPKPIWATKCRCQPIADPSHWENARGYILKHVYQGAAVWPPDTH